MNGFANLSDVCALAVSFHPGLTQIKSPLRLTGANTWPAPRCASPLSVHLLLVSAELQHAQLSQSRLQLLFAVLHLLLQMHVDAAELHVVGLGVCLFTA